MTERTSLLTSTSLNDDPAVNQRKAYYRGRNDAFNGTIGNSYIDEVLRKNYQQGVRDARAENRLDVDGEWD